MFSSATILFCMAVQVQALFHMNSLKTFNGPANLSDTSLFGYSIAYQAETLYVSDPTANHKGQVYFIDINTSDITNITIRDRIPRSKKIMHDYWLGATIKANADTFSVQCMPRYAEKKTLKNQQKYATFGVCYLKTLDQKVMEMSVVDVKDRFKWASSVKNSEGIEKMDSLGWSIDITPDNKVLVGGPAIGTGQLVIYNNPQKKSYPPNIINKINPKNPVQFNFGYSVASGYFFERKISYAASTTFGMLGHGKVYFFDSKLDNVDTITEEGFGSMFGAALCSLKLSGKDGLTALLIGAPAFVDLKNPHEYDVGAVFLYMAKNKEMKLEIKIKGKTNGAYFGFAITNLGDMDGDYNDEIAIAAPYEDEGRGAIYIYTSTGILKGKHSQKLHVEQFQYFGFSMTMVQDINENGCNELAVTSPKSQKIVMIQSIASITVTLRAEFSNLQNTSIKKEFEFESCIDVKYPDKPEIIEADLIVNVKLSANATIKDSNDHGEYVYVESLKTRHPVYCQTIGATLRNIEKKTHHITYDISAKLKDNPLDLKEYDSSKVLLSERSNLILTNRIWISDCGNRPCMPILGLYRNFSIPEPYLIGSSDDEQLSLFITNSGETAYDPCVEVTVLTASIIKHPRGCSMLSPQEIRCTRSKPLRNNSEWIIENIKIETKELTSKDDTLKIKYVLYDTCSDKLINKTFEDKYGLTTDVNGISIKGVTIPDDFPIMTLSDIQLGKTIEHQFMISNDGITNWIGVHSNIILEKIEDIKNYETDVMIYTEKSSMYCTNINSETKDIFSCEIADLKRSKTALVVVQIKIPPNTVDLNEDNKNITIATSIELILNDEIKNSSLLTILQLQKEKVPIWIIVMACLIGFFIICIIAFLLYKCGFLRRKKKDVLLKLKRNVYRQSMQRSIMRESMRATASRRSTEEFQILPGSESEREHPDPTSPTIDKLIM